MEPAEAVADHARLVRALAARFHDLEVDLAHLRHVMQDRGVPDPVPPEWSTG